MLSDDRSPDALYQRVGNTLETISMIGGQEA